MKLKHQIIAYTMIPALLGLGILGINSASANGWFSGWDGFGGFMSTLTPEEMALRHQAMFQKEADLLGVSIADVKAAWAAGKTLAQLAQEKGLTPAQLEEKLKAAQAAQLKDQLKALVDKGVISQAQADQRLQFAQNQQNKVKGKIMGAKNGRGPGLMKKGWGRAW